MSTPIDNDVIQDVIRFHGHWCPGLAIGIRAAEWALNEVGRAGDEEVVAVVETDMCGVDAIQYLTGCTFGKGNLIHLDLGKNAFAFFRRRDQKAIRIVARPDMFGDLHDKLSALSAKMQQQGLSPEEETEWRDVREAIGRKIMSDPLEKLFELKTPTGPAPQKARILRSLVCEACGESTMESRTRRFRGQTLCIPCFDAVENRH